MSKLPAVRPIALLKSLKQYNAMQTFLPRRSFAESAKCLDNKRLNKQRVETFQLYNIVVGQRFDSITDEILGPADGFRNHPAARMWKTSPHMLCLYGMYISEECNRRGIQDHRGLGYFFERRMSRHPFIIPAWLSDDRIDRVTYTHQCNLIRKDAEFYRPQFPDISIGEAFKTDYYWPV